MIAEKKISSENKWGIDLTGRIMRFAPWPVDSDWKYLSPGPEAIERTYGISGEAVRETLLYFEECAAVEQDMSLMQKNKPSFNKGDDSFQNLSLQATTRLIRLLNDHFVSPQYMVSRDVLLDASRYYSNEFYFYFIMFTKKIIGRYDFHYGERSNGQLSIYHKTYEKGCFEGVLSTGGKNKSKHISSVTFSTVSDYLNCERFEEEIKTWIRMLLPEKEYEKYLLARDKYFAWFRLELVSAIMDFYAILSNRNNIIFDSSHETVAEMVKGSQIIQEFHGPRPYAALGKIILLTVNQLYSRDGVINTLISRSNTQFRLAFKANLEICSPQYKKYYKSVQNQICMFYRGGGTSMPIYANISPFYAELKDHSCIRKGDPVCDHEFFWPRTANRHSTIFLPLLATADCILLGLIYFNFNSTSLYIILFLVNLVVLLVSRSLNDKKKIAKMILDIQSQRQSLITQNRSLEELNLDLENKVVERTNELHEANMRLTELDHLKTQFFSNISHELRTPLTLLLTPLEAMTKGILPVDREHLELMYRNSTRLFRLINTLLDFSKIAEGHLNLARKNINLSRLISDSLTSINSPAWLNGVALKHDITQDLYAFIDRNFFEKAFFNLLSNALKFSPQSGKITVTLKQKDEVLILEVRDTGIGIPAAKLDNIFDRFSQVDCSSSRKFEGTGIGLAFTKEIIELHDGSISVSSTEGEGSVFTIKLAAACPDNASIESANTSRKDHAMHMDDEMMHDRITTPYAENVIDSRKTLLERKSLTAGRYQCTRQDDSEGSTADSPFILVVEDNSDMRAMLRSLLHSDYTVIEAENGKDALRKIAVPDTMPDIILADVMMPLMDGFELTRQIRKNQDYEGIPVILLTAKTEKDSYLEGFGSGAVDYVIKPFHAQELKSRIKAQLDMKLMRDRLKRNNALLYEKLQKLIDQSSTAQKACEISDELLSKINLVETFIHENFTQELSRDRIASVCKMSPDYLSKTFLSVKGIKLFDYLRNIRLQHAAEMLEKTDKSVISIAYASGFENIRTFNRQFKKKFNTNPVAYREQLN